AEVFLRASREKENARRAKKLTCRFFFRRLENSIVFLPFRFLSRSRFCRFRALTLAHTRAYIHTRAVHTHTLVHNSYTRTCGVLSSFLTLKLAHTIDLLSLSLFSHRSLTIAFQRYCHSHAVK